MADILPRGTFGVCRGKSSGAYEGRREGKGKGYVTRGETAGGHILSGHKNVLCADGGVLCGLCTYVEGRGRALETFLPSTH